MVSSRQKINKILKNGAIGDYNNDYITNCGYLLSFGRAFEPHTGKEIHKSLNEPFEIKPNQALMITTKETINFPSNICASYSILNRLAIKGLMLLNASYIEPGYHGKLTCILLNFSDSDIHFFHGEPITKLVFFQVAKDDSIRKVSINDDTYIRELIINTKKFGTSFLNIDDIKEKAAEHATKKINNSIIFGGVVVTLIIIFTSLEPVLSKVLADSHKIIPKAQEEKLDQLTSKINELETRLNQDKLYKDLSTDLLSLKQKVNEIEKTQNKK